MSNLQTLCSPCNQRKSRKEQRYHCPVKPKIVKAANLPLLTTNLTVAAGLAGSTVQVSITHRTHAGALAHFTELLGHFTQEQHQREAASMGQGATTTEADEDAVPAPPPLFNFGRAGSRSSSREEPPFWFQHSYTQRA